jgi:hypothetical protein
MKTATFALASAVTTSAVAKTEKDRARFVKSLTRGRIVLADPDPIIRAEFLRECAQHEGAD